MVNPSEFVAPVGELEAAWFPQDDRPTLLERITGFVTAATDKVAAAGIEAANVDAAVRAWVYYSAYRAIYLRLSEAPASQSLTDVGAKARTDAQRDAFRDAMAEYQAAYLGYMPVGTITTQRIPSGAVRTKVTY